MRVGLAPWILDDSGDTPVIRPVVASAGDEWSVIDLRPDSTVIDGWCVVALPDDGAVPDDVTLLADDLTDRSVACRSTLANKLGLNLDTDRALRWLLMEVLVAGDDHNAHRWNELKPTGDALEVWIGGERAAHVPLTGYKRFTESFDAADSSTMGPGLAWTEVLADWIIFSNQVSINSVGLGYARAEHDADSDDNFAQATYVGNASASNYAGPCCRFAAGETTFYAHSQRGDGNAANSGLFKVVAGVVTQLNATVSALLLNDLVRVEAHGSTIRAVKNGITLASITDTSIPTGRRAGLRGSAAVVNRVRFDNFAAGDLVQAVAIAQATHGARAGQITPAHGVDIGQAREADMGGAVTTRRRIPIGQALTAAVARPFTLLRRLLLGQALETDVAHEITPELGVGDQPATTERGHVELTNRSDAGVTITSRSAASQLTHRASASAVLSSSGDD